MRTSMLKRVPPMVNFSSTSMSIVPAVSIVTSWMVSVAYS